MASELTSHDRIALMTYMDIMNFEDEPGSSIILLGALVSGCLERLLTQGVSDSPPFVDKLKSIVNRVEIVFVAPSSVSSDEFNGLISHPVNLAVMMQVKAAMVLTDIMLGYVASRVDGDVLNRLWFDDSNIEPPADEVVKLFYGASAVDIVKSFKSLAKDDQQFSDMVGGLLYAFGRFYLDQAIMDYHVGRLGEDSELVDSDRLINSAMVNLMSAHSMMNAALFIMLEDKSLLAFNDGTPSFVSSEADQRIVISSFIRNYWLEPQLKIISGIVQSFTSLVMAIFSTLADNITVESLIDFKDDRPSGFLADFAKFFGFDSIVFDFYRDFFGAGSYDEAMMMAATHLHGKSSCQCGEQVVRYMKEEVTLQDIKSHEWVNRIGDIIKKNHSGEGK